MKRILLIPALAIIALIIFSCEKKEGAQAPASAIFDGSGSGDGWSTGYVLRVDSAFYTLATDTGLEADRTKYDSALSLGERVLVREIRKATFQGDGVVYDFMETRRDNGSEGLGWASQVVKGGSLAVVVDDKANLFGSPRAVDVSGTILSRGTVAVWYPETERDGFVEVRAFDPATQAYVRTGNNYIRLASLSRREADIQSSILLQTARPLGNEGANKIRKDALLEMALLEYPDSVFSAEIRELANPNATAVIATEPASRRFMIVNDHNVNVRDLPDPAADRVIGQVTEGDEVTVNEQTVATFAIDGQRARWYRITEPIEGWVFGAYLE